MLKSAIFAALCLLTLSACATATQAVEEGARGLKLSALDVKDAAVDLKDTALDAKDWGADLVGVPPEYHGRGQPVCGFLSYALDSHNIYPDAPAFQNNTKGFGVVPGTADHRDLQRYNGKYVCVTGEVYYRGCGKERTCDNSDFPYAVRVDLING